MAVFVHPPRYSNSMQKRKGSYELSFPTFLDFLGDWFLKRKYKYITVIKKTCLVALVMMIFAVFGMHDSLINVSSQKLTVVINFRI